MMRSAFVVVACLAWATHARAGMDVAPVVPDTSTFATKSELNAVQSAIPQPADSVPPPEMIGGLPGTPGRYRPGDARAPRITRSKTLSLAADGTATFDWSAQGALSTPVQVVVTPVYSGAAVPKCWATAVTATSASVKCVLENITLLTIVGIGVGSITNSAPSGMPVGVIALPPS
jgi:hypothetical protein